MGGESPPNLEDFAVSQGKMVVKCTSAGQSAGQRTIGELLLPKRKDTDKEVSQGNLRHPKKNVAKLRPWSKTFGMF